MVHKAIKSQPNHLYNAVLNPTSFNSIDASIVHIPDYCLNMCNDSD